MDSHGFFDNEAIALHSELPVKEIMQIGQEIVEIFKF
jgi:hypothetical protein